MKTTTNLTILALAIFTACAARAEQDVINKYLTLVEAQEKGTGRRYYKAYLANDLTGSWESLTSSAEKPFAGVTNVKFKGATWSQCFSHGELLRAGNNELLEVEPANLKFLYQGVSDSDRAGKVYGQIPWRLGLLEMP